MLETGVQRIIRSKLASDLTFGCRAGCSGKGKRKEQSLIDKNLLGVERGGCQEEER
jgi:hypothetical protein